MADRLHPRTFVPPLVVGLFITTLTWVIRSQACAPSTPPPTTSASYMVTHHQETVYEETRQCGDGTSPSEDCFKEPALPNRDIVSIDFKHESGEEKVDVPVTISAAATDLTANDGVGVTLNCGAASVASCGAWELVYNHTHVIKPRRVKVTCTMSFTVEENDDCTVNLIIGAKRIGRPQGARIKRKYELNLEGEMPVEEYPTDRPARWTAQIGTPRFLEEPESIQVSDNVEGLHLYEAPLPE